MDNCSTCVHWKRQDHHKDYKEWAGWCRRYPKVIVGGIVRWLPNHSPVDAARAASHWPTTSEDDICGEFDGGDPC